MLALLKSRAWQLLALVLAALLLWQSVGHLLALRAADKARADLATERATAAAAAAETSERYRKLEGTYRENLDTITRESGQAQARAAADADAARAAAGRLRGDLADYITAHRAAADARAAAGQCTPDAGALDLLAELQRRADERAGALARIADDARSRGSACERTYDAGQAMSQAAQFGATATRSGRVADLRYASDAGCAALTLTGVYSCCASSTGLLTAISCHLGTSGRGLNQDRVSGVSVSGR